MKKQYAVLGLGSFGWSVATTLETMGCDVLAVDESYEKIQEISEQVAYAIKADVADPEALEALGSRNLDGVVIAVSENFEASVMATMLCKELGIPKVLVKAKDKLQGSILERVGADSVVYPEIDMGSRVWPRIWSQESLRTGLPCPVITVWWKLRFRRKWVGKSLAELKVRERFGINVVGLILGKEVNVTFDPASPLPAEGILILIGANDILEKFDAKKK